VLRFHRRFVIPLPVAEQASRHRIAKGQKPCSAKTGAYCQARERLPEKFFSTLACSVGTALDDKCEQSWRWKGRRVYLFDGTTVDMPDTPGNQDAYPQVYNQKQGLGFPIARVGAIISLACGAIVIDRIALNHAQRKSGATIMPG
jgi:hypothetical protein